MLSAGLTFASLASATIQKATSPSIADIYVDWLHKYRIMTIGSNKKQLFLTKCVLIDFSAPLNRIGLETHKIGHISQRLHKFDEAIDAANVIF
jgi:hypothetical protein